MIEMNYLTIKYRVVTDGIEILGIGGKNARIQLPERIEGLPVVSLAPYAFSTEDTGRKSRKYKNLYLNEREVISDILDTGEALTLVRVPETVTNIGDYCFYNCLTLEAIYLPKSLTNIGYGAFKNCEALALISQKTIPEGKLCLNAILEELYQTTRVVLDYGDGQEAHLVFPEYDYDIIPQHEARKFDHIIIGSGSIYRQFVTMNGVDYRRYDDVFEVARREDVAATVIDLAIGRLRYPYGLTSEHEQMYLNYLRDNGAAVANQVLETNEPETLRWFLSLNLVDKGILEAMTEKARQAGKSNLVGLLLDDYHRRFPQVQQSFEL